MKSYTDLEQSKELAKILPLDSADMSWAGTGLGKPFARTIPCKGYPEEICPCWSLAALLNYLREIGLFPEIDADEFAVTMYIASYDVEDVDRLVPMHKIKVKAETFIEACVEMIIKLHERKLINELKNK